MRKPLAFGSGVILFAFLVTLVVWQGSFNVGQFSEDPTRAGSVRRSGGNMHRKCLHEGL